MNLRFKVLLVITGGVVTSSKNSEGALMPCHSIEALRKLVPEIETLSEISVLPMCNLDSANFKPDHWVDLAKAIYDRMDAYDGFVITHGKDTLGFTAAALSFMLQDIGKPIVLTASQLPLGELGSDAHSNLVNAFRVAISEIAEIVVVFGSLVIRGTRAKQVSAFDFQAFKSINAPPLGTVGLSLKFEEDIHTRSKKKPLICSSVNPNVTIIQVYPGFKAELLMYLASTHSGIVLQGYGEGNLPYQENSLAASIQAVSGLGIPVVTCTQCLMDSSEMELYQVGLPAIQAGAIPAMDMIPETALVKLMWVLGQTTNLQTVDFLMQKSFAGELYERNR